MNKEKATGKTIDIDNILVNLHIYHRVQFVSDDCGAGNRIGAPMRLRL
jgi:hypothetical protein